MQNETPKLNEKAPLSAESQQTVAHVLDMLRQMLQLEPESTPEKVCAALLACAVQEKYGPTKSAVVLVQRALIAAALETVSKETFLRRMEMGLTKVMADIERHPMYAVLEALRHRPVKGRPS